MWQLIEEGENLPQAIMDKDKDLLASLQNDPRPILHFYRWGCKAATYGHFLNPYDWVDEAGVKAYGLTLAKRPTGGGMVFHLTDLAFSLLIPSNHPAYSRKTLQNYCWVNQLVMRSVAPFLPKSSSVKLLDHQPIGEEASGHFCMALPTQSDITVNDQKLSGGAMRCTRHGFLHQGTISICPPPEEQMREFFKTRPYVYEDMQKNSAYLSQEALSEKKLEELKKQIEANLKKIVCA